MIEVVNESGEEADELALEDVAEYVLAQLGIHPLAELSVLLVDESAMTELHLKWMDEPGPTDVLSFPMDELRPPGLSGATASSSRGNAEDREPLPDLLGDVVLCPSVAQRQARRAGHSAQAEMELLCVHGVLHLLGYDHADPEEEAEMFGLQAELLRDWRRDRAGGNSTAGNSTGGNNAGGNGEGGRAGASAGEGPEGHS
ncbi:MAG: rRNA maturation RNase YbeY [Nocardiopsaceae bacterium]|nr:rRNA maturation RNase YbeY [Nocardiopsaceae bacterium]